MIPAMLNLDKKFRPPPSEFHWFAAVSEYRAPIAKAD
jgi:hypothetical protein